MSTPSKETQSIGNSHPSISSTQQPTKISGQNLAINLFNNLMSVTEVKLTNRSVEPAIQSHPNQAMAGKSSQSGQHTPPVTKTSSSNEKNMRTPTAIQIQLNNKSLSALKSKLSDTSLFKVSEKGAGLFKSEGKRSVWDSLAKRLFIETSILQLESATLLDVPSPLSMANETMEYVMLHEVQSAFLDMQGVYLKWDDTNAGKRVYAISKDLEPSTFHFVSRILPCVSDLETLRSCCSTFLSFKFNPKQQKSDEGNLGRICRSFFSAISKIINNFLSFLAEFEEQFWNGDCSLLKFWIKLEPFATLFSELVLIAKEIILKQPFNGGSLINFLYEKTLSSRGNSFVYNNLKFILTQVSHSYNEIVLEAIQTGVWHDPLGEFCVILKTNYNPITDIDKCSITPNKGNIPYYLVDIQTKIFDICKFYQIFKRCSVILPRVEFSTTTSSTDVSQLGPEANANILNSINNIYDSLSKQLFQFLVNERGLLSGLKLFCNFYFMQKVDFFHSLFTQLEPYLSQRAKSIPLSKVISTFNSLLPTDTNQLQILFHSKFYISQLLSIINVSTDFPPLMEYSDNSLKVCDSLILDFVCEYPLNVIFNKRIITKYQLLFRHVLFLFSIQFQLPLRKTQINPFVYHQLSHFITNIRCYFITDILSCKWALFYQNICKSCSSLYEFEAAHEDFLDSCLSECLLTEPQILRLYSRILLNCIQCTQGEKEGEEGFLISFKLFVDALYFEATTTDSKRHLINLLYKIDFNNFYSNKFEQK